MHFVSARKLYSIKFFVDTKTELKNFGGLETAFCLSIEIRFRSVRKFTPCRQRFKIRYFVVGNYYFQADCLQPVQMHEVRNLHVKLLKYEIF